MNTPHEVVRTPPVLHWLTISTGGEQATHPDHYRTATEALQQRVQRLKAEHTPYTVNGNTITYDNDFYGQTTLTYQDA